MIYMLADIIGLMLALNCERTIDFFEFSVILGMFARSSDVAKSLNFFV